jgi:hypothetical protein
MQASWPGLFFSLPYIVSYTRSVPFLISYKGVVMATLWQRFMARLDRQVTGTPGCGQCIGNVASPSARQFMLRAERQVDFYWDRGVRIGIVHTDRTMTISGVRTIVHLYDREGRLLFRGRRRDMLNPGDELITGDEEVRTKHQELCPEQYDPDQQWLGMCG